MKKQSIITKAYQFAKIKHRGQYYNGKPYIDHPCQVVKILASVNADTNMLAAGYLHDVSEDQGVTYEELKEQFNEDIANLVKEVTKDENKDFPNLHTWRGLMLKTADRLANVSNGKFIKDQAREEKLFRKYANCPTHEGTHLKNG